MQDHINFGPLVVILDASSGAILAILDRITQESAEKVYSPGYVRAAEHFARQFWASRIDAS